MSNITKLCPYCAEEIKTEAVICKHCKSSLVSTQTQNPPIQSINSQPTKINPASAFTVILIATVIIIIWVVNSFNSGTNTSKMVENITGITSKENDVITMEEYNKLADNISYDEACSIIGERGEEISRNNLAGFITVAYCWKNINGANAFLTFQNDKLVSKAQAGLR